ncbi:hypothetical protein L6452_18586 [Arctium lappa]|uniref:Uncharacterized protein n=1 Tax=Arctium lappa TaxID=4217 RepID=A0ACB9C6I4_ARCLA|nr:hypothetical protein L6452_18586 [Arctium lappa]
MKMIADQLANVGNPVNNHRLVLQLIVGLNDSYEGVAMLIQQTNPLPDFYEVRSKLVIEEACKAHQAASTAASPNNTASVTALTASSPAPQQSFDNGTRYNHQPSGSPRGRGHGCSGGRGRGRSFGGRGRNSNNTPQPAYGRGAPTYQSWASTPPPWAYPNYTQWAYTPCPHPTQQSNLRPPLLPLLEFWAIVHNRLLRPPRQVTHPRTSNKPSTQWRYIHPIRHGTPTPEPLPT